MKMKTVSVNFKVRFSGQYANTCDIASIHITLLVANMKMKMQIAGPLFFINIDW